MKKTYEKSSNSLVYKKSKIVGKKTVSVNIRLNDECKNGHQDFAITAEIYEKARNGRNVWMGGGCQHEEILKVFPEFKMFVDLHLCDYLGIPIHCSANGFYFLTKGFNKEKPTDENFEQVYCEYYRVSSEQFAILKTSENETQFAMHLINLGILEQWKLEAEKAIEYLEELTQTNFVIDSVRTQFHAPKQEDIELENERLTNGYYSAENKLKRQQEKDERFISEMRIAATNKKNEIDKDLEMKILIFKAGGRKALDNIIFYNHNNQIEFNWKKYGEPLTAKEIGSIKANLVLPEGVKYKN